jgi:sugar phosphate isomerase/epimerase
MMSLAGASVSLGGPRSAVAASGEAAAAAQEQTLPIYVFSKPLDGFEVEFMADTLAGAGADGFDLTVRPRGKVEPEAADQELPQFAEAIRKHNLVLKMMVTAITHADTPHAEQVLKTASTLGIRHYRLGYLDYDYQTGIWESLQAHQASLQQLAALNRHYHVQAGYQNHSGTRVGAAVWDLWELLRGFPVEQMSVQYDVRHAVAEGAFSWISGMHLVRPLIGSLAIKDFTWDVSARKARIVNVPLGEGLVDFDAWFKLVKQLNLRVPLTLHVEYPLLSSAEESLSLVQKQRLITAALKRDVDYVRTQLAKHQIS